MDTIETLIAIDNRLVDWILHATPDNPAEKENMRRVFARRSTINQQINRLVLDRILLAVTNVSAQVAELNALSQRMTAVSNTIASVTQVLAIADQVVAIAATIVALLAV